MKLAARRLLAPEQIPLWMLVFSLCGVGAAVLFARGARTLQPQALPERPRIHWLPAAATDRFDPSLMSLPSARGFSGKLWERAAPVGPPTQVWESGPLYFDAKPNRSPGTLLEWPALVREVRAAATKLPVAAEELPAAGDLPLPVNRTVIRVAGSLAERPVWEEPAAAAVRSDVTLRPTRLRVGVGSDGRVQFATVERTSGDAAVDGRAIELARQLRFEPRAAGEELQWGVLQFLWAQANGS